MKKSLTVLLLLISVLMSISAQKSTTPSLAILELDANVEGLSPATVTQFLRLELGKTNQYDIWDQYDVDYLVQQRGLSFPKCHGQLCGLEIGKTLEVDKILIGSLSEFNNRLILTIRILDIQSGALERSSTAEYINNPEQLRNMVKLSIYKMHGRSYDQELNKKLTLKFDFENSLNVKEKKVLALNGPRLGAMIYTGDAAKILQAPKAQGGFDAAPVLSQIGYQAEFVFLNKGSMQGLFELIPMVTGLEQGIFIPSLTILSGFRDSRKGIEFAIGPTASVIKKQTGYFDATGAWIGRGSEAYQANSPYPKIERWHSGGWPEWHFGFILGVGKTFQSGSLNIPINLFYLPARGGNMRFGISVGFNSITEKRKRLSPKKN